MENFIICAVHILREDNYLLILFEKRVKYFSFIFLISGRRVGFNQKVNSHEKWTITTHLQAAVSGNFKAMMKLGGSQSEITSQTINPGKSKKIIQELLHNFPKVANLY